MRLCPAAAVSQEEPLLRHQSVVRSLATVAAVTALFATAGPAAAAPKPVTRGSTYLALGDSVTFGYKEPTVVPAPDYSKASSFVGFPEQLGKALRLKVVNAACPGETSASLIDSSKPSNGCENAPTPTGVAYRTRFPLHVRYSGSQLTFAVRYLKRHRDTRLVSLMIGANDYFLCQATTADACTSLAEQGATLTQITRNVRRILFAVRHRAGYRGQLAIVDYYSLNYASPAINLQSRALNAALHTAARPYHVATADGFRAMQAAVTLAGGNPCTAGLLTPLSTGTCGVHPSYAGQALLAQALLRTIRV